jgi:hypothetical protein
MDDKESLLNINKPLPKSLILSSAGNHLYMTGVSPFSLGYSKRSKLFVNSFFGHLCSLLIITRCLISNFIPEDNPQYFIIIGDFCYFIKLRYQLNISITIILIFAVICQLIHYYNYANGIIPVYLRPFQLMSGLVSPQSIGITDRKYILIIQNRAKLLFKITTFVTEYSMPLMAITLNLALYLNCTIYELLIFAIPWAIIFARSCYTVAGCLFWQLVYFYLICLYLKYKLRILNNNINMLNNKLLNNEIIKNKINLLNQIYLEIINYDNNYWSKFAFCYYVLFSFINSSILYCIIFVKALFIVKLFFYYNILLFIICLICFMEPSSLLSREANKSYNLLMRLQLNNYKKNLSLIMIMKVLVF